MAHLLSQGQSRDRREISLYNTEHKSDNKYEARTMQASKGLMTTEGV